MLFSHIIAEALTYVFIRNFKKNGNLQIENLQIVTYHIKSHLMDQITLEKDNLILFNHAIIHFEVIFMNYMHQQLCKDDETKNLKTKKKHQIID